ncbi:MAG: glycosyltransferase family 2 protein [Parachlamydiales bacterium]|jgi:glycosyltransferase involved in cell wall biosynthesis
MKELSIVIIGRNEADRLENCFKSVIPLEAGECIYVDSDSKDNSVEIAKKAGAKVIAVPGPKFSAAIARNIGWKAAKGEWILFVDGDSEIVPETVLSSIDILKAEEKIAIVYGETRERYPDRSYYQGVADLDNAQNIKGIEYCGGNALIRKTALQTVSGYDEYLYAGEEPEMCQRMVMKEWKIRKLPEVMAWHDLEMDSFKQYWLRNVRTGMAYAAVAARSKELGTDLWTRTALKNIIKAAIFVTATLIIFISRSPFWLILWLLCIIALVSRTSLRALSQGASLKNSILYGIHSHFIHLPMAYGQMKYYWKSLQEPIEYK